MDFYIFFFKKNLKFLFYFFIIFSCKSYANGGDCVIDTTQTTTINSDCDGFELTTTQNYDITINSGVSLIDAAYVLEIGWPLNATVTNNGTITAQVEKAIWVNNASISEIVNSGTIDAVNGTIFLNNSTISTLNNSGTINASSSYAIQISAGSLISSLTNSLSGRISAYNWAIENNSSTISSVVNYGQISAGAGTAIYQYGGTLTTLNNLGSITSITGAIYNDGASSIGELTNSGTISASANTAIQNLNGSILSSLENTSSGTIQSTTNSGIYNDNAVISNLTNAGSISSLYTAIDNRAGATITTLSNTGTLESQTSGYADIYNAGTIVTLNNSQGALLSDTLTYSGALPTNYNIIINTTSNYGKVEFLSSSGEMNFGIHSTSTVSAGTYSSIISGISYASRFSSTTGTSSIGGKTYNWTLTNPAATSWDLTLELAGPSAADTQASIRAIKGQLQGNINSLTAGANFANMNTYDCNLFDSKGGCFSFGSRYTDVQSPSMQTNSFVATGGYKIDNHFRIAGFIDQNLNNNTAHNIDIENKGPLVGLIGVWNQNANQLGWQIKVANAYQSKDASIKRSVTGSSEAGSGKTDIDSQSYVAELSYNYAINSSLLLRPYMALRYALVKQEGYTETGVDNPLTYNSIRDRSKTALVGLKVKKQLTDKVVAKGSVGLEHDLSHKTDNLEVSGVSGLTSESFTNKLDKTRPVASVGADYYIDPTQRLSATAFYQELPFASTKARTLYLNYMLAF